MQAQFWKKNFVITIVFGLILTGITGFLFLHFDLGIVKADTSSGSQDDTIAQLQQQIAQYQAELDAATKQANTLKNTISSLDTNDKKLTAQLSLTNEKISATNGDIQKLQLQIADKTSEIGDDQNALADTIRQMNESDGQSLLVTTLTYDNLSDFWNSLAANNQFETTIKNNVATLQGLQKDLQQSVAETQTQKTQLVTLQNQISGQESAVEANKSQESQLLAVTKNKESNYQALLAAAKAQLASFSSFTKNAGGSGLLSDQTSCDSWGCYYNQRDTAWGNDALNGTQYRLASDGCLITSMAMVMTHYGYSSVTPVTINSNPENFAAYYPAYLLDTISVDGATAVRKTTTIDATLTTGNPVIVGLNAYGGTHFVVLISGSGGNYLMRDPYIANGKDINFSDHYSLKDIYEINKVEVSS